MAPRFTAVALVGLAAAIGACDQPSPAAPMDGLSAAKPAPSSSFDCLFTGNPSLSNSAGSYFPDNNDRRDAADLISQIEAAREAGNDADAQTYGFALLSMVGRVSRSSSPGDRAIGALLTKQAFNCMFDTGGDDAASFEGWPNDAHYDFEAALDADNGGAYFVRGAPDSAPAVGNIAALNEPSFDPAGGNVSAIAPPSGSTWSAVLGQQVLFFGEPVEDGYDWKVLPRDATFSPFARVALCQGVNGAGEDYTDVDMVHQLGVGVIGFIDASGLCGTPPPFAALHGRGVLGRLARLGRSLGGFLSPEPLHASLAVLLSRGGTAGGAKGDEFTFRNTEKVDLAVSLAGLGPKNTLRLNTGRFSVTVVVTTQDTDEPVGGINVMLSVSNNNGTPTNIYEVVDPNYTGACTLTPGKVELPVERTESVVGAGGTKLDTKAVWDNNLCISSTGGAIVNASSVAEGNGSAGLGTGQAAQKINVKP
jgi:hypothetical protein